MVWSTKGSGAKANRFCQENTLVISNALFQQNKRQLYTWTSGDSKYQIEIDYILCSQRWRSSIQSGKKKTDVLFIIGDWNAKVRSQEIPGITDKFGAKSNRVLLREHIGHSKYPLPTIQEKTPHMDITRWSILKSD